MNYAFPSSKLPRALNKAQRADIAASFQKTAVDILIDSLRRAEIQFQPKSIVIAGGVAANKELREQAKKRLSTPVFYPDIKLCTDNAAMIAASAYYQAQSGQQPADPYSLDIIPNLSM